MDVRISLVLRSTGRTRPNSLPSVPLSPATSRNARPRSTATPSSLLRELLMVLGRMNAPLSPSARTGSRLVEGPREDEAAAAEKPGPEPGGERRCQRQRRREVPVALHADRNAEQEPPLVVGQPADRGRVGIDPEVAGAGEVAAEVQHAERLPGDATRVAPEMGSASVGRSSRRRSWPREAERRRVRLVPVEAAGETDPRRHQAHVAVAAPFRVALADEPGRPRPPRRAGGGTPADASGAGS